MGAEIKINQKLKGECPLDAKVGAGDISVLATKKINNKIETFTAKFKIGDDVSKRIEVLFGPSPADQAPAQVQSTAATAQRRYDAELAEYEQSIKSCLPKHEIERQRLQRIATADMREWMNECRQRQRDENNKSDDLTWEQHYRMKCGLATLDDRSGWDNRTESEITYDRFPDAQHWCSAQFTKPIAP